MNDYRFIEGFTVDVCNKLHLKNIEFIKSTINMYKDRYKIVILSHHAPLLLKTSKARLTKKPTNYAFASDQTELMKDVDLWIYGHTHYNHKSNYFHNGKTALISNQVGYPTNYVKDYNKDFFVFQI